jgi:acyl-coenzyme A thioesterase PaaI-like protein
VSGPVLMSVADVGIWVAIMGQVGLVPMTVTTSFNINFLRKPSAERAIVAECRVIKCGRSLSVGEATLYSEGAEDPVAHAVATYAMPVGEARAVP